MIDCSRSLLLFFCLTVFFVESGSPDIDVEQEYLNPEYWTQQASPTGHKLRRLHFVDASTGWAAGDSGAIIHTGNGGESWELQNTNITHNILDVFFLDRSKGWALAWKFDGTVILRTNDGGANWIAQDYQEDYKFMKKIHFMDSLNGVMGGSPNAFVYTNDGGMEWNPVTVDSGLLANFPVLHVNFFNNEYGFAVGGKFDISGVIWKTTNGGKNWVSMPVAPEPLQQLIFLDSLKAVAVGGDFEFFGAGVARTQDAGVTWEYNSVGVAGVAYGVSFRSPAEGWACLGAARKFIVTPGSGKAWRAIPTPDNAAINDLVFTDSVTGFAVGDSGVIYRYAASVVNVTEPPSGSVVSSYQLHQNYPNPFNPVTNIEFRIPRFHWGRSDFGFVSLKIYDVTGREVATIVSEWLPAGTYEYRWDAGEFPSGVYFYHLQAGQFSEVKKMILMK